MKILGIETSCDETSIATLEVKKSKIRVLSNIVSSQVKLHSPFGGVVPSLAAREHEKNLAPVLEKSLKKAKTKMPNIDLIAVTQGPGLEIALWKGINFALSLAKQYKKPIIGINHLEAHIYSNFFKNKKIRFPALNLIVSGGHTQLVLMTGHGKFKILGETMDDAAGEAFDKVARMLNLGYPGGPIVAQKAAQNKRDDISSYHRNNRGGEIKFPRPMINQKNYNFSFSGLKTAVLYLLKEITLFESDSIEKVNLKTKQNIAASFQQAVVDVLVSKTIRAAKEYKVKSILLSGGVSANRLLRKTLEREAKKLKLFYSQPDFEYTGDNAAMIALAGYYKKVKSNKLKVINKDLRAEPNLRVKDWRVLG